MKLKLVSLNKGLGSILRGDGKERLYISIY